MDTKSDMYIRLERLYRDGELSLLGLDKAVAKKWITVEEYAEIINETLEK